MYANYGNFATVERLNIGTVFVKHKQEYFIEKAMLEHNMKWIPWK